MTERQTPRCVEAKNAHKRCCLRGQVPVGAFQSSYVGFFFFWVSPLKEQRLRYLKQQERRQQQTATESEKLQRLKERVESQEAKLKKIRAMRGQVDYSKVINGNLCTSSFRLQTGSCLQTKPKGNLVQQVDI